MKFVLVNDRATRASTCANCSTSIGFAGTSMLIAVGVALEVIYQQFYCDHACYLAKKAKSVPVVSREGAGIDGLPIGDASVWA